MSKILKNYHKSNVQQVSVTEQLLKSAKETFSKKNFENGKLIDIGSGDGRVLVETFIKMSGINFFQVIGTDKQRDAVDYAQQLYGSDKIKFEVLDIENGNETDLENLFQEGKFDLATSFFVLHYMADFDKVFANINKLLKPEGSFYFNFITSSIICEIFSELAEKRPNFKKEFENYLPTMAKHNENFQNNFPKILNDNGFEIDFLDFEIVPFNFESEELTKGTNNDEILIFFLKIEFDLNFSERISASIPFLFEMDENSLDNFFEHFLDTNKRICEKTGKEVFEFQTVHAHGMITKKKNVNC